MCVVCARKEERWNERDSENERGGKREGESEREREREKQRPPTPNLPRHHQESSGLNEVVPVVRFATSERERNNKNEENL